MQTRVGQCRFLVADGAHSLLYLTCVHMNVSAHRIRNSASSFLLQGKGEQGSGQRKSAGKPYHYCAAVVEGVGISFELDNLTTFHMKIDVNGSPQKKRVIYAHSLVLTFVKK